MNLREFIIKYNGKKVDFDGAFGAQCVDLFRQYNKDVWGNPHTGAVEGAKDLVKKYSNLEIEKKLLNLVPVNTNFVFPGDVAVWGETAGNKYGHVAIVVLVLNEKNLVVFEQDGFKQDGAKLNVRPVENIIGFLRNK